MQIELFDNTYEWSHSLTYVMKKRSHCIFCVLNRVDGVIGRSKLYSCYLPYVSQCLIVTGQANIISDYSIKNRNSEEEWNIIKCLIRVMQWK